MLNPQPFIRSLDCVRNQPQLLSAIVDACQQGQVEALNRVTPNRATNYRGTEAYFETVEALCNSLRPMGYLRQEVKNQIRLLSPPDQNGECHRFLVCRGTVVGSNIAVNPKGFLTYQLIMQENWHHVLHLPFGPAVEKPPKNIWIIIDSKPNAEKDIVLTATLALPYPIAKSGTEFQCEDTEMLYSGLVAPQVATLDDLPEGVQIDVVIDDNTGTND